MIFSVKSNVKLLSTAVRRAMDAKITAILGGLADDLKVDRTRVWRRYGDVEIIDSATTKIICGEADSETIAALYETLTAYGCKIA